MQLQRFAVIILGFTFAGAIVGAAFGLFLGAFFPEFPRLLFGTQATDGIDPIRLSVGMGIANGAGLGCVSGMVGAVLVTILKNRESKP